MIGFTFKGLGLGVALGVLVALIVVALESVIASPAVPAVPSSLGGLGGALTTGGFAAAVSTFVSFALTPVYLAVLRSRDEHNKETSGFTISVIAMLVAVAVFLVVVMALVA